MIKEGRLLYVDYPDLEPFEYPNIHRGMFIHAPSALFYVDTEDDQVKPLAIGFNKPPSLGSTERSFKVFTPSSKPGLWRFAKMHASVADMNYYQFAHHLGAAHLAAEPIAVAIHNHFRVGNTPNHWLGKLLLPVI